MTNHETRLRQVARQASTMLFAQGIITFGVCLGLFSANWDKPAGTLRLMSLVGIAGMAIGNLAGCWAMSRQLRTAIGSMAGDAS